VFYDCRDGKMKIGIFDSGLGGLSVLHCARQIAPDFDYIFYADEKNVPYGEKAPEQVKEYARQAIDFLVENGAEAVIIACNTATSALPMEIRNSYGIPVIGMEPAIKQAVRLYGAEKKRILIAATEVTINGKKLHNLVDDVDRQHQADMVALPGLVRFAERGIYEGEEVESYLSQALSSFDMEQYGTVVLGCTHFNYFKNAFINVFGRHIHFVDGNRGTVNQVLRRLGMTDRIKAEPAAGPMLLSVTSGVDDGRVSVYFSGMAVDENEMQRVFNCLKQLDLVYGIN
jgi:glutamate racemase